MIRHLFAFVLLTLLISCKSDQKNIDQLEANMDSEQIYFQDYEAPINHWGFVDTLGKIIIGDKYDAARPFRNDLAIVNFKGRWGMIDKNDTAIIDFKYRSLYAFEDGLARFQNFDQKYGFLDKEGNVLIEAKYDEADDFHEGLAKVGVNGFYQYIKTDGSIAFDQQFTKAGNFNEGLAKVKPFDKYGMIDKEGREIIPASFENIYPPSEDVVRVKSAGKFGFYQNGKVLLEPQYTSATDFHQGKAAVKDKTGWLFVDKSGKVLSQLDYNQVDYGNQGFWMVNKNRRFGMLDADGVEVIPCKFKLLYKFKEDRCAFSVDGFWGFFDTQGNITVEPDFALVWDYNEGLARALGRQGLEVLDLQGRQQFLSPSIEIRDFSEGLAPIQYMN